MADIQQARERAQDLMEQGKITADEANVLIVQIAGIMVIRGKLFASVRKALNQAVKSGELGRVKKDGLKPEIYHHKNARCRALEEQHRIAIESIEAIKKVVT